MVRPVRRSLIVAAMVMAAAGCAEVGPNYRVPAGAEVNASAAQKPFVSAAGPAFSQADPPDGWWRLYQDATLDRLIGEALAANTDLRVAAANLERAEAMLSEARAARQPDATVNFNTNYTERSAEAYVHPGPIPAAPLYDTGVSVSYDFDLFGRLKRSVEAAGDQVEATRAARDLVRVNVAAETARAYAEACNAGHELAVAHRLISLQQQSAGMTRRLAQAGRDIAISVDRQEQQVDTLRANVPGLEARQAAALYRLATLAGRAPSEFEPQLASCETPLRLTQPLPVGDGADLLKRRPDIRAAERRLAASTAEIGVATAALYPTVTLGASLGSTGAVKTFASPLTERYSIGPGISWRLNQSVPRARIAEANAEAKADLARFDGVVLNALREAETALTAYSHDLDREADQQSARDRAQKVADGAHRLEAVGRIGSLAVLDADRTLAGAEQALAVTESQISQDQIAVFLALGGGWS
jgi:NodT family efflux transporter outer membrane factor (OMF) lipoprotein